LAIETNQATLIELLRQVHTFAIKEIERLNLRVAELEKVAMRQSSIAIASAPVSVRSLLEATT
jgi:hypothetical protein